MNDLIIEKDQQEAFELTYKMLDVQSKIKEFEYDLMFKELSNVIDYLIDRDLNSLLQILYRIDVDEEKLKQALQGAGDEETSGPLIAQMIIERQLQKIYFRRKFSK